MLTSFVNGSKTVSMQYDANGIRRFKQSPNLFSGTKDTTYIYDDEGRLLVETTGTTSRYYIYSNDGIVGYEENGEQFMYRKNLFGDITAIYKGTTKVAEYQYDAWGNCTITLDKKSYGTNNPFRYRGYYYDNDLGMYYLMTRYYDPKTGRFINADSIEYLEPNAINGLNLYAYCKNNPIMHSDPYGTDISYDCWVDEGYDPEDDLFENGGGGGGGNSTKSATNKYTNAGSNNNNGTAGNFGPNASAKNIANSMGYTKVNGQYSHGQSVYYNSKTTRSMQYISQDATSHSGGYWKAAGSVNDLFSKTTRTGTFNWNLTVRIGG